MRARRHSELEQRELGWELLLADRGSITSLNARGARRHPCAATLDRSSGLLKAAGSVAARALPTEAAAVCL